MARKSTAADEPSTTEATAEIRADQEAAATEGIGSASDDLGLGIMPPTALAEDPSTLKAKPKKAGPLTWGDVFDLSDDVLDEQVIVQLPGGKQVKADKFEKVNNRMVLVIDEKQTQIEPCKPKMYMEQGLLCIEFEDGEKRYMSRGQAMMFGAAIRSKVR